MRFFAKSLINRILFDVFNFLILFYELCPIVLSTKITIIYFMMNKHRKSIFVFYFILFVFHLQYFVSINVANIQFYLAWKNHLLAFAGYFGVFCISRNIFNLPIHEWLCLLAETWFEHHYVNEMNNDAFALRLWLAARDLSTWLG